MRHLFTAAASAVFTIALAAPAAAQFNGWIPSARPGYEDQYRSSYYQVRRLAYDNGFREGIDEGRKAARKGDAFDPRRKKDYRKATKGYRRDYGDKDRYRDVFRAGFLDGYRQGYGRTHFRRNGWRDRGWPNR
jgi:flagellar biosynthesis/type III secretory pathway protein FliH